MCIYMRVCVRVCMCVRACACANVLVCIGVGPDVGAKYPLIIPTIVSNMSKPTLFRCSSLIER